MDHPSRLFERIRRQQARPVLPRRDPTPATPAPVPAVSPAAPTPRTVSPALSRALPLSPAPPTFSTAAAPTPVAPVRPAGPCDDSAAPAPTPAPRPARSHTLYSQIMRSHDRMGTRHL